jgi:SNF2 family DNA or RNA helicase
MAFADLADDAIVVTTVWNEKDLVKLVPGARWHSASSLWRLPLTWATCAALRGVFREQLGMSQALADWSRHELETRVWPAMHFRAQTDAPADYQDPRLYPFQRAGVNFLLIAGDAMLADDMGTGKTVQVLSASNWLAMYREALLPALVICPNSVKWHWANLAKTWLPGATPYVLEGSAAKRRKTLAEAKEDPTALVMLNIESARLFSRLAPYGSVKLKRCRECDPKYGDEALKPSTCHVHRKEMNGFGFKMVTLDEAHRIKDPQSQQTRAIWAIMHDPSVVRRWGLTGTPIVQNVGDLWPMMHAIAPYEYPVKSAFVERYCLQSYNPFGGMSIVGVQPENRDELFSFLDPRFRRITKAEVLPQLPSKVREPRFVDMESAQARMYHELDKRLVTRTEDGELWIAQTNLVSTGRLLQLASSTVSIEKPDPDNPASWVVSLRSPSPKLDALEEVLEELGDTQCVVAAEHRQLIELAAVRLNKLQIPNAQITGAVSTHDRERALQDLRDRRIRVLLFTSRAGGTGLDMSCVDTLINLQRPDSLADALQTEDRVHRIGSEQHEVIRIIDIITRGTIEETQIKRLLEKMARLDEITRDRARLMKLANEMPDPAVIADLDALDHEQAEILATNLMPLQQGATY